LLCEGLWSFRNPGLFESFVWLPIRLTRAPHLTCLRFIYLACFLRFFLAIALGAFFSQRFYSLTAFL
jgi:hypothetical protein